MRKNAPSADTAPIRFAGRLDEALYRRAARVALGGVLPVWLVWALVATALGVGLALAFALGHLVAGALAASLGLLGIFALFVHEAAARRAWTSHGAREKRVEGALAEDGVLFESPGAASEIPWHRLHGAKASRGLLLLYPTPRRFDVLAAEFFATPDDWRAARRLVARKAPGSQRKDRRRLLWIFLASFLLFLAATLAWTAWHAP